MGVCFCLEPHPILAEVECRACDPCGSTRREMRRFMTRLQAVGN